MDITKTIKTYFWKPFEKQPGWIYLVCAVYLGVAASSLGGTWGVSTELWVTAITPILYFVGDFLDGLFFKQRNGNERFELQALNGARKTARDKFEIQDGVYEVSLKLLGKADQPLQRACVHFQNELAKFLRSLVLPLIVVGFYLGYMQNGVFGFMQNGVFMALIALGVISAPLYYMLKLLHMKCLYKSVSDLVDQTEFGVSDLTVAPQGTRIRLFFWEGSLVATATLETQKNKRTRSARVDI